MRHVLCVSVLLAACAADEVPAPAPDANANASESEPGDEIDPAALATLGGPWAPPLSPTWSIGFNIVNSGAPGWSSCFNRPLGELVHAGEDWFSPAGSAVRAIGSGTVEFAQDWGYPGWVIVIRHELTPAERTALGTATSTIYSQYGHLVAPQVWVGQAVAAGQQIGSVYNWGSNSHVHWEVRTARAPGLCSYSVPGPGYTNNGTDARNWGYLSPRASVAALAGAGGGLTCDNNVPVDGTACAYNGDGVEYVCKRPGAPSNQQWDARACTGGNTCQGAACSGGGGGWNCADSQWGNQQLWTCGADGERHKCVNGAPVVDACASGCYASAAGRDDLCMSADPSWNCAWSAYGSGQLWTCSGGDLHQCQGGAPVRVDCPSTCQSNPYGTNDTCL